MTSLPSWWTEGGICVTEDMCSRCSVCLCSHECTNHVCVHVPEQPG